MGNRLRVLSWPDTQTHIGIESRSFWGRKSAATSASVAALGTYESQRASCTFVAPLAGT